MTDEWPLVGRASELARLQAVLSQNDSTGAVVIGPAGVGKTRLGVEFLRLAREADCATVRITATRATSGIPFGALAPLLPAFADTRPGAVDNRWTLLRRAASALVESADGRSLVVFADDAQLLDNASATVIHQLAAAEAAFVVATVNAGELVPDPIVALWKDGLAPRVELRGLDLQAVEQLLTRVLGGAVARATVVQLAERCEGNVLFLRELVLGALQDGSLREDGGLWRLVGSLSPSDRLIEQVEARLTGLSDDERALLEAVSLGEPLGSAELTSLGNADLAESLERKALLTSQTDERRLQVRIAHPLYSDVLRARLPVLRERAIARRLAEAVEATGGRRREDALRIGTWRLRGGGGSAELLVRAARAARWSSDFQLAHRLALAAIDAGAGFDAALLAEEVRSLHGEGNEAEVAMAALAGVAASDAQRGAVAAARFDNLFIRLARLDEADAVVREAEAAIGDPVWRDEVAARHAALAFAMDGPRSGAKRAEPLLESTQGDALTFASLAAALSLSRLGRLQAALDACSRWQAERETTTLPWHPEYHDFVRCWVLLYAGRLAEAEQLATGEYQRALTERAVENQAHFAFALGLISGHRGRPRTAEHYLREAISQFDELGYRLHVWRATTYLALILAMSGRPGASDAISTVDGLWASPKAHLAVELAQARAWVAAGDGDLGGARRRLVDAAAFGEEVGELVATAAALHDVARLGRPSEVVERLGAVAEQVEGDLVSARLSHTEALASRNGGRLESASCRFEAIGADLLAAETAADAATAWRASGEAKRARAALHRAAMLADRCEGARTPGLQPIETRVRLTGAERETALLAVSGLSNRDIAERLHLSLRTIENRLQHVYEKLGISGRGQLHTAFEDPAPSPTGGGLYSES